MARNENSKLWLKTALVVFTGLLFSTITSFAAHAPTAPSNLTATATSASSIALKWSDQSGNEQGFRIQRSTDGINFAQIATVGINQTGYTNSGLVASKKYYYRVQAYNQRNSAFSNVASATTTLAAPTPTPTPIPTPTATPVPTPTATPTSTPTAPPVIFPTTIQNNGFELGNLSSWIVTGNVSAQSYVVAKEGRYFAAFNDSQRSPNGSLSQTIATTPGITYSLTFYSGIEAYNQIASQKINVTVVGLGTLFSQSYSTTVSAGVTATTNWVLRTIIFKANNSTTTVKFSDDLLNPTYNTDLLLDLVTITPAVMLAWDASISSPVGYKLHWALTGQPFTQSKDVGNTLTTTLSLPDTSSVNIFVTGYDNLLIEGVPSNTVTWP